MWLAERGARFVRVRTCPAAPPRSRARRRSSAANGESSGRSTAVRRRTPLRQADRLHVAREDHQRIRRVAGRALGARARRLRRRPPRRARPVRPASRAAACPPSRRRARRGTAAGRARRGRWAQAALGRSLRDTRSASSWNSACARGKSGVAQQVDRIHLEQRRAHQPADFVAAVGMPLQHLQEEPEARGGRDRALAVAGVGRAHPRREDARATRRARPAARPRRARDEPVGADRGRRARLAIRRAISREARRSRRRRGSR